MMMDDNKIVICRLPGLSSKDIIPPENDHFFNDT